MNTKNTISNTSKYFVKSKPQFVETGQTVSKSKGSCKYYISTLEVGGGLKEILILLIWLGGGV